MPAEIKIEASEMDKTSEGFCLNSYTENMAALRKYGDGAGPPPSQEVCLWVTRTVYRLNYVVKHLCKLRFGIEAAQDDLRASEEAERDMKW